MSINPNDFEPAEFSAALLPRYLILVGINHRSLGIADRERFAISQELGQELTECVRRFESVKEVVVLSTCNRVEIIVSGLAGSVAPSAIVEQLSTVFESVAGGREVRTALYCYEGRGAAEHVFRVACGLDSLVLGEPQILGQVKDSFSRARAWHATGVMLNYVFERAFAVAKEVRSSTRLGEHAVSLSYAAREVAEQVLTLRDARVLVIGAGEMGALAARYLARSGIGVCYVANKTVERAAHLAHQVPNGIALGLGSIPELLAEVDIVIGAAARGLDDEPLVSREMVDLASRQRQGRAQLFVDLGVPRNFESAIGNVENVFLYNVDDLESVVQTNMDKRMIEAGRAEIYVQTELERFLNWARVRSFVPAIQSARSELIALCSSELEKIFSEILKSDNAPRILPKKLLQKGAERLAAKFLHRPLVALKHFGVNDESVREVFEEFFIGCAKGDTSSEKKVAEDPEPSFRRVAQKR